MKEEIKEISKIDFADSYIQSYHVKDQNITLLLECWDGEIIEFKFLNFCSVLSMNYFYIESFQEITESPLLERALMEFYEKNQKNII